MKTDAADLHPGNLSLSGQSVVKKSSASRFTRAGP